MMPQWIDVGAVEEVPLRGSRAIKVAGGEEIAVFRTGSGQIYALINRCPHKNGPLSQGMVRRREQTKAARQRSRWRFTAGVS